MLGNGSEMRILVCGGRDFANPIPYDHSPENKSAMDEYRFVMDELNKIVNEKSTLYNPDDNWLPTDITIISGEADGVDSAATDFAVVNYTQYKGFPADWKTHGKAAGPIRNQQMLDEGKPDLVIAFPGGNGTADMVRRARKAGVEVREIKYEKEREDKDTI